MLDRWAENGLLDVLEEEGIGCIAFSPLSQGLLTNRYLTGIPSDSRIAKPHGFLNKDQLTPSMIEKITGLNQIAKGRNQSLAQMAIAWLLKDKRVTSVLVGASSSEQLINNLETLQNLTFTGSDLKSIENVLSKD
jgi:L-glyceraldehyde 3-phosphate reductase